MRPTNPEEFPAAAISLKFARALVTGDFEAAYDLLAPALREKRSLPDLRSEYEGMVSYFNSPPDDVGLLDVDYEGDNCYWAYVAIDNRRTHSPKRSACT